MAVIHDDITLEADADPNADPNGETATRTAYRTCPLCEASCGLEITLKSDGDGGEVVQRIRGDMDDVFLAGSSVRRVRR